MNAFSRIREMRKHAAIFTVAALFFTVIISGCSKDDAVTAVVDVLTNSYTNEVTFTGNGYTNKTTNFALSSALYTSSQNMTAIAMNSYLSTTDTVAVSVLLSVPGKATGTYAWADYNTTGLKTNVAITMGNTTYISGLSSGKTIVSSYNAVGGKIEGTYSGTLYNLVDSTTMTVSGKFSATRIADK